MKTVYAVIKQGYDYYEVVGVFDNITAANNCREYLDKKYRREYGNFLSPDHKESLKQLARINIILEKVINEYDEVE